MATTIPARPRDPEFNSAAALDSPSSRPAIRLWRPLRTVLKPLASLKLTVVLFAMAVFIVLAGTLAQVGADIWEIIDVYFRVDAAQVAREGFPWIRLGAFFTWIDFQLFLPASFFPARPDLPAWFGIYFPKGWLIGAVMMLNLFAAHLVRFKVQTSGTRLWAGIGTIALGALVTALVVLSGDAASGFQGSALISWNTLWVSLQVALLVLAGAAIYGLFTVKTGGAIVRVGLGVVALALAAVLCWTVVSGPSARLDDAYMRILYQLIKGTLAGVVLLAGCVLVFRKRAGIVLLHSGIGLMMVSEVLVGLHAEEAQMRLEEGHASNYVEDIRTSELAFIRTDEEGEQTQIVIPARLLQQGATVSDPRLPVDVEVLEWFKNSDLVRAAQAPPEIKNPATAGAGQSLIAVDARAATGTDTGGNVDAPAAYVRLRDKDDPDKAHTYLVSIDLDFFNLGEHRQSVTANGEEYEFALRFKRTYKPYTITLDDIRKEDYVGTDTPRDYSSFVRLTDENNGIDRDVRIWMNNPLRYSGETFYQSNYIGPNLVYRGSKEWTSLQVVKNTGWMLPYVACMIVLVGMLAQFGLTLWRFLQRRARTPTPLGVADAADPDAAASLASRRRPAAPRSIGADRNPWHVIPRAVPVAIVAVFAIYLLSKARLPSAETGTMDLVPFGRLPVVAEGRVKPLDTLARNSLLVVSDRQEFRGRMDDATLRAKWSDIKDDIRDEWEELTDGDLAPFDESRDLDALAGVIVERSGKARPQVEDQLYELTSQQLPAIRWLLDVISEAPPAREHRVFRIENLELLDTLGLPRRDGFRYSIAEFADKLPAYLEQLAAAEEVARRDKEQLTFQQRKVLEFRTKLQTFQRVREAYQMPELPPLPEMESVTTNPDQAKAQILATLQAATRAEQQLEEGGLALTIPVLPVKAAQSAAPAVTKWQPFSIALMHTYLNGALGVEVFKDAPRESTIAFHRILDAYRGGRPGSFNDAVADYGKLIAAERPPEVHLARLRFEVFFNYFAPFYYSAVLYLVAFMLTAVSWLAWPRIFSRAAFWLIVFTLLVHTFAIVSRIYISGRPPVTNLYSSAVFIGWACVAGGLLLERIYRLGIGNIIASVAGFITLGIAHLLAGDGDTFTVLQAVLDTQFWLATHVVCITLGYATTYLAGLLGLVYILRGVLTRSLTPRVGRDLTRMIYGGLCFALFFSFIGTVLGGLWADDSWGRFWGWDPKENGALIIVLWNALVLHARWDGMVKDRGLAVLAVLGNICVSWSWFGVNELGVGLHSYGFTQGVLLTLGIYCTTQLLIAAMGCLPKTLWLSSRSKAAVAGQAPA